jgi:hypothetical protein
MGTPARATSISAAAGGSGLPRPAAGRPRVAAEGGQALAGRADVQKGNHMKKS